MSLRSQVGQVIIVFSHQPVAAGFYTIFYAHFDIVSKTMSYIQGSIYSLLIPCMKCIECISFSLLAVDYRPASRAERSVSASVGVPHRVFAIPAGLSHALTFFGRSDMRHTFLSWPQEQPVMVFPQAMQYRALHRGHSKAAFII